MLNISPQCYLFGTLIFCIAIKSPWLSGSSTPTRSFFRAHLGDLASVYPYTSLVHAPRQVPILVPDIRSERLVFPASHCGMAVPMSFTRIALHR
jgi:hypothetical protein